MMADSTQWADVAWYSYDVPGSQFSRHLAKASRRPCGVVHSGGPERRVGEAAGVQHHLLDGDDVLAVGAELGHVVDDPLRRRRPAPSPMSAHIAPATNALVHENTG